VGRTPPEPPRIAFLGFGLVNGSIARALRAAGVRSWLVAWTPRNSGPAAAVAAGVLDAAAATADEAVREADLVVLGAPATAIVTLLDDLARAAVLADGATVTDVGSTKARIMAQADAAQLPFVGGHPMAGRELAGFAAATEDLFVGRPWVIVPGAAATLRDVERVEWLASKVGAHPVRMAAADHDRAVAAISHLPLVVAAALVDAVTSGEDWPAARLLAASGWRDMTRLAGGDPDMGAGILATNAAAVSERLEAFRAALDEWIAALRPAGPREPDIAVLRDRLEAAGAALDDGAKDRA
jgi:prephenate dehydrogenase